MNPNNERAHAEQIRRKIQEKEVAKNKCVLSYYIVKLAC